MGSSAKKSHGARWALPAVLLTAGLLWAGNFTLGITEVDAPSKNLPAGFDGFRIALITDLHGRTFGKNNDALVEKTRQAVPTSLPLRETSRTKRLTWRNWPRSFRVWPTSRRAIM